MIEIGRNLSNVLQTIAFLLFAAVALWLRLRR
jgi:hypothetical protein